MAEVLSFVVEGIVQKVLSLAAEEMRLAWGFKADLKKLSENLQTIQALICDSESKQVRMSSVQRWLKKLKGVACKADDVLDEFAFEVLRRKQERKNKVHDFFSHSNPLLFRLKMAHKIKDINSELYEIYKEASDIGLKPVELINNSTTVEVRNIQPTPPPFIDHSHVVGRENDVLDLASILVDSNKEQDLFVISLVGMAGLGKTSLAQMIYNNENVVSHFSERMWICVSDNFDANRLLNEMIESLTKTNSKMSNMEAMIRKLQDHLKGKRYLLVLDDVWNENQEKWDCMRNSFLGIGGSKGSKIMVTTRSELVAKTMQSHHIHSLEKLSDDDSWSLFKQRAFVDGGENENSNLVAIGRTLVKRCGGVPLAIKSLGGLMLFKKNEQEWLTIQNSEIWGLPENINGVLPSIRLSFDHLSSPSLKQCLAYCSVFPKDFIIDKNDIIQIWMAQGYLQPSQGSNLEMEDLGNYYVNVLLWNSLFQDAVKDELDNIKSCKMHDLVHDLTRFVSKCESFAQETVVVGNEIPQVRHLALYSEGATMPTIPKETAKGFCSLFLRSNVTSNMLLDFKCLRVLNLFGAEIEELPTSICKLIHLRYLNLSWSKIKLLPESIGKLYNLQTLRVNDCFNLGELPKELRNLINLRHLYFNRSEGLPIGVGQLTCLQTLSFFDVGRDKGRRIEELGHLKNLRGELAIYNLQLVNGQEEAQSADLSAKLNLYNLTFQWIYDREGDSNDEHVLEGLQPHQNLKSLTIENFMGYRFPSWIMKMEALVVIRLFRCHNCEEIPMMGQLPLLRDIHLEGMDNIKCIGHSFYGDIHGGNVPRAYFPALKRLGFWNMPNLVEWVEARMTPTIGGGNQGLVVFPNLEVLHIKYCPQLTTAPSVHFPCLKELHIKDVNSTLPLANISSNVTTLTSLLIDQVSELISLPDELLENNKYLAEIDISWCSMLTHFGSTVVDVPQQPHVCGGAFLRRLIIFDCMELMELPDELFLNLKSLEQLLIRGCPNLKAIPCNIKYCTSLETLNVQYCCNLISFPDVESLRSLSYLCIIYCASLTCLPKGLGYLTRLNRLEIGPFSEDISSFSSCCFDDGTIQYLQRHLSLRQLILTGRPEWDSLPDQLQHLTSLTGLYLFSFGFEALPDWFGDLSSLEHLWLSDCHKLKFLPSMEAMRRLTKLKSMLIGGCGLLRERCYEGSGPEWSKISHIPRLSMD